jgi:hypothetical protein
MAIPTRCGADIDRPIRGTSAPIRTYESIGKCFAVRGFGADSTRGAGSSIPSGGIDHSEESGTRTDVGPMIRSLTLPLLAVVMLAAACTGASTPTAGTATSPSATAVADAQRRVLAARYLAIATVGNRGLDRAFHGLDGPDHGDLVAARADLHDAAATDSNCRRCSSRLSVQRRRACF